MEKNIYYECANCNKSFSSKYTLSTHVQKRICLTHDSLKCKWCNVVFKSKGNLQYHIKHMHGNESHKKKPKETCIPCGVSFFDSLQFRYHVRRKHFNLCSKTPLYEIKKLNQIWFENVLNTNDVIEIKKTGHNTLLLRRAAKNSTVKNSEVTETINLVDLYPTGRKFHRVTCKYCHKKYMNNVIKKHIDEFHLKKVKHKCNNCQLEFKRSYIYLHHVCNKTRNRATTRPKTIPTVTLND